MLSICIPVYNVVVIELVNELYHQSLTIKEKVEIIVIDDKSMDEIRLRNSSISTISTYIELPQNIGRSRIRNHFLIFANYEYLLFLDCDVIIKDLFIKNYISYLTTYHSNVICGGYSCEVDKPKRSERLRWLYSKKIEEANAETRKKYNRFATPNLLIKKEELSKYPFDESIVGYGHEDTLMGMNLRKNNIKIDYFDNPVYCYHLDSNQVFVEKTNQAIDNLLILKQKYDHQYDFNEIKLISYWSKLKNYKLNNLFYWINIPFKKLIENILISGYGNLFLFNYYKLIIINSKLKSKNKS